MAKPADPDMLTARQVAAELGLSLPSVYEGAARGAIPHRRIDQRVLFSRLAIKAWMHEVKPIVPPDPSPRG